LSQFIFQIHKEVFGVSCGQGRPQTDVAALDPAPWHLGRMLILPAAPRIREFSRKRLTNLIVSKQCSR